MNEKDIKNLKEKCNKAISVRTGIENLENDKKSLYNELYILEQNEIVKEYLNKKRQIVDIEDTIAHKKEEHKDWNWDEDKLLIYYGTNYTTNNIYVCIGSYSCETKMTIECNRLYCEPVPNKRKILPIDSDDAAYRIYLNIENKDEVIIKMYECADFEKENTVLFPPSDINTLDYYNQAKLLFFKTCLEEDQEKAVQKIMKLKDMN